MIRKLLLRVLFLLLPILGFGQVDLVQWNGSTDLVPTILDDLVVASSVTGNGITGPTPGYDGITGSGWSTGAVDLNKYFQITLNPILDGSVVLNEIRFTYKGGYNSYQVRYSKAADFSNPVTLTTVTNAASNNSPTVVSLTTPISVNAGEKIYIRFYAYNGNGDWKLMNGNLLRLRGTLTAPSKMIGPYVVGSVSGASFPTISAAVKALVRVGARGDVTFLLDNPLYDVSTTETFPIVINPYDGNDLYKVTFKPNTNKTVLISASNNSNTVPAVFKLNGVDRVVFDGSNTENGTTKDLTLYNATTSTNSSNKRAVIWIASQNSSNGSNNNEIKNIILSQHNKGGGDYSIGIYAGGTSEVTSVAEAANSNTTVTNVEFNKVGQAIFVNGNSSLLSSNWYVRNNTIGNTSNDNTLKPYVAVNFSNVKDYEVSNNTISGLINDINQSVSSTHAAIWVSGNSNGSIFNNKISNLSNSLGNGTPQSRGIYIASNNNLIYNNFISNVYSSVTAGGNGIYINSGTGNKIYYNTIVMNNTSNPSGSSCLYINGGSAFDIKNNIFLNSQTTGNQFGVYSNVNSAALTAINYNDYYAPVIGYLGSNRLTLDNWKTATGKDANSKNLLPSFTGSADFHLTASNTNNELLLGILSPDVTTTDIDGHTRTKPYMGADEIFSCISPSITTQPTTPTATCAESGEQTMSVTVTGSATLTYVWKKDGTAIVNSAIYSGQGTNSLKLTNALSTDSGSYTVTISNSCGEITSNTIQVTVYSRDRGTTNGGKYICLGDTSPLLTANNYSGSIVRWEYAETTPYVWKTINHTGNTYQPGILSTSTSFRAVVQNGTCPERNSIETRINVNTQVSMQSQSTSGQTRCDNVAFNSISVTATGSPEYGRTVLTYQWYRNTTNSTVGATNLGSTNGAQTNTYTPQFGTAGVSYYYYCIVTGYCNAVTSAFSGAFINDTAPTNPSASVTSQPSCGTPTGTITITTQTGVTYSINGTDYYNSNVFSSLAPGYYTISVRNSSGCTATRAGQLQVLAATAKTWTGSTSSNWNTDGNWSPSGIPTSSDCVVIPSGVTNNPIISGTNLNFYAYTLTVNDNASLTVQSTNTLNMTNGITVLSSASTTGVLEFKDSSSLLQSNTDPNINSGNILYNRTTLPVRQADYTYWSSPVKGETVGGVSPNTEDDKYYTFNSTSWVGIGRSTLMVAGKGYIIRAPESYSNTERATYNATFKGVPNNGTITGETAETRKFYLVGNPYPSALDADTFILANNFLEGTLYFWTHNTPVVLGGYYRYSTDDYASYNLSGSVKTSTAAISGTKAPGNNNTRPSGKIGAGQAFFAGTKGPGTFTFNNDMRLGGSNNSQFFKPGSASKTTALEKNRVWLNMTNTEGAFKQLLVGYIEGATNGYDSGFDGVSFDGNKYLDFYSINSGTKYVIQGRSLPFDDTDTVPLGYRTTIAGDFTIAIDETDGSMDTQAIYLEDKNTGTVHDLRASNYTFTTAIGTFADRFVLKYVNKTLGTGDFENTENGIVVSVNNKTIQVFSSKENIKEVTVYDITGKLLFNKTKVNATELQITNLQSGNQVLLVKVTLENDYKTSKKIIFN